MPPPAGSRGSASSFSRMRARAPAWQRAAEPAPATGVGGSGCHPQDVTARDPGVRFRRLRVVMTDFYAL